MNNSVTINKRQAGQRLDVFCKNQFPAHSRASLQKLIKDEAITVNNHSVKPSYILREGDTVAISLPSPVLADPAPPAPVPVLPTIYEDEHLVVINKPAGLIVHTDQPHEPSVAAWFIHRYPALSQIGDPARPGLVHRLDRDTSGVMVLAKSSIAFKHLQQQFKKHFVKKEYLALVFGQLTGDDGRINQSIIRSKRNPSRRTIVPKKKTSLLTGKTAITEWRIERPLGKYTLLRVYPLTGRTHQIRVHLHFISHPIVGDHLYTFKRQSSPPGVKRQMLHAEKLSVKLPSGAKKTFHAPLPDDFTTVLQQLGYNHELITNNTKPVGYRTPSSFQANQAHKSSRQK